MDPRVRMVIDTIERDLAQPIDWRKAAASVRLSPSGLRSLCVQHLGVPPSTYVKNRRLEWARERLRRDPTTSVKEIMASVGLSDESHFVRDFRKAYGESPKQYRRHHFDSGNSSAGESANELAFPPTNFRPRSSLSDI